MADTTEPIDPQLPAVDTENRQTVITDKVSGQSIPILVKHYPMYIATGNFRDATPEEFEKIRYNEEDSSRAQRYGTLLSEALPGGTLLYQGIAGVKETPEELRKRVENAQEFSGATGKFAAFATDIGAGTLASIGGAALGAPFGPAGVIAGASIAGGIYGAGKGANLAMQHPEAAGELVAVESVTGAIGGALGEVFGQALGKLVPKIKPSVKLPVSKEELDAKALHLLKAMSFNKKSVEEMFDRNMAQDAVANLARYGGFDSDVRVSVQALDKMKANFQSVFNNVASQLDNKQLNLQQIQFEIYNDAISRLPTMAADKKAEFRIVAKQVIDDLTGQNVRWGFLKEKSNELAKYADFAKGQHDTPALTEFRTAAVRIMRKHLDDVAQNNLSKADYAALKQANSEFITHMHATDFTAARLLESQKAPSASRVANFVLAAVSAARGNFASADFNAIQFAVRRLMGSRQMPESLLEAFQRAQAQGLTQSTNYTLQNFARSAATLVRGASINLGTSVAAGAVVEKAKQQEVTREMAVETMNRMLQFTGSTESYNKFMLDNFQNIMLNDPKAGMVAYHTAQKIRDVLHREMPKQPLQQILDNPEEVPEISDMDQEKVVELGHAVFDPADTLMGEPTPRQVELIKEIYPSLTRQYAEKVLEELAMQRASGGFPPADKLPQLKLILGGGTTSDSPDFVLRMQAKVAEMTQRDNTPAPPRSPSAKSFSSVSSNSETPSQRVGRL